MTLVYARAGKTGTRGPKRFKRREFRYMFEQTNIDSIQIGMASSEQILAWSYGEVSKPETINRTR